MFEAAIDFGVGFLSAVLLGLLAVPPLFKRRLHGAVQEVVTATPYPPEEIRADKEQLRAKLASSTRQLETSLAAMKAKTLQKLGELEGKSDAIAQLQSALDVQAGAASRLRAQIDEKAAAFAALEDRNRALIERLRVAETQFAMRGNSLSEAEDLLAEKDAELVKLGAALDEHSATADRQRSEIDALREQVTAVKRSIIDYEDVLNRKLLRLADRDAERTADVTGGNGKLVDLGAHRAGRS